MEGILAIVVRSLCVYFFMIAGIRIFGKNQLSQLNTGDVILLLLISNAVQNAMVGQDTSLQGGLIAALVLFAANFILKRYIFKNKTIRDLIETEPVVLLRDGVVMEQNLKSTDISMEELQESIREHGMDDLKKVKLCVLEVDGNISVVSSDSNDKTHFTKYKRRKIFRRKL
jgi:uncharacterized membrane protein YcaP (DUF421 family)